jgi:predicted nucleic acid-binding protein
MRTAIMAVDPKRGLIDTNIVILREWMSADVLPDEAAISAVTLAELSAGPHAVLGDDAPAQLERARRTAILQSAESEFEPLPFDTNAARIYGQISGVVRALGRSPRARHADLQVAATAAAHGLPLYTTNADDYVGLESLVTVVAVPRPAGRPNP